MINVLGIGVDYLMLNEDNVRGDVRTRQFEYAKYLASLTMVTFSPKILQHNIEHWGENIWIYPTNSYNKALFIFDAFRVAFKICQQKKFDVITTEDPFTCGLVGFFLKKIYKIPLNVQVHIDFCDERYWIGIRKINRLFHPLGKFVCKHADSIRVDGRETKDKLALNGVPEERISVISVHSDIKRFLHLDGTKIRRNLLKEKFTQILLFVGRFTDQKDIPTLFNAFELILKKKPKTLLLLIGKGSKEIYLKNLAQEKGIYQNITFTGAIEHAKIPQYYSASDIFVLPSIVEGRATVLVEAMLSKKPIVTTDVSGVKDWILNGKTGFIVKRKNHENFAEKVIYLLDNPEIARSFGEKGYELAQNKSQEISDVSSVIELWEKTAKVKL
ncbi:MAG: glycosyltransferase family 4 protein [Candidatus Omnitrophota bacterium]